MFFHTDTDWTRRCEGLTHDLISEFGDQGLRADNFGFVALREGEKPAGFAYRGDWRCYPCSLVKAFHLVHVLNRIEAGKVHEHDDLDRAMHDMIAWSSNTATNYIIDLVTETTGDTRLEGEVFARWRVAREGLNRFFLDLNWPEFAGCNITQKLMDDIRYGREAQYAGPHGDYLNALTPLAGARLFHELFSGHVPLSDAARARAWDILLRDRTSAKAALPHFQVVDYLGGGMPANATLWSKAGRNSWTGDPRASYYKHDLVRVVVPERAPLILCLMTQGKEICEERPDVFPRIGQRISAALIGA